MNAEMNTVQKVLNLLLKGSQYEIFKSSFTAKEEEFLQKISESSLESFRVSSIRDQKTILTWTSQAIEQDVACYVGEDGFNFLEIELYKPGTKRMLGLAKNTLADHEVQKLNQEIDELKDIFRAYDDSIEEYFK